METQRAAENREASPGCARRWHSCRQVDEGVEKCRLERVQQSSYPSESMKASVLLSLLTWQSCTR